MQFYTWITQNTDILGLAIDILALIVSVILTILIYRLERRNEKRHEEAEEKSRKAAISETAKIFLIDNEDEIEYLPLAVVASNLKLKRKHHRNIITKFLRCSEEIQEEILRQANIQNFTITMDEIDAAVVSLDKEMRAKNYCTRSILYDRAKYFHRAFERWSDVTIEKSNPYIFEDFDRSEWHGRGCELPWRISNYCTNLLHYMLNYCHPEEMNLKQDDIQPPVDMVFEKCNLGSCPESDMTFWTMRIIIDSCKTIVNPDLIYYEFDESLIKTQEDMYYYTILILYNAYLRKGKNNDET